MALWSYQHSLWVSMNRSCNLSACKILIYQIFLISDHCIILLSTLPMMSEIIRLLDCEPWLQNSTQTLEIPKLYGVYRHIKEMLLVLNDRCTVSCKCLQATFQFKCNVVKWIYYIWYHFSCSTTSQFYI